jgi:hypothetical protein
MGGTILSFAASNEQGLCLCVCGLSVVRWGGSSSHSQ